MVYFLPNEFMAPANQVVQEETSLEIHDDDQLGGLMAQLVLAKQEGPKHEAMKLQGPGQKMLKLARQGALSKQWRRRRQGPTRIREQVNN
jgi:hypothetical protein